MEFAFAIRMAACAVLGWMALAKLASPRSAADELWRPSWLGATGVVAAVVMVSSLELGLAIILHVGLFSGWARAMSVGVAGTFVSAVGLLSVRSTGRCGCGRPPTASGTVRTLIARNVALFGLLAAASLNGPSLESLKTSAPSVTTTAALTPLVGFMLLAATGAVRRLRHRARSRGDANVA